MLLTIDVGNTNTVLGVFEGASLLAHWRLTTRREQTADEYGILVRNLFATSGLDPARVDDALARRGLERDGYILFLSRVARAKGIYDLVAAFGQSRCRSAVKLVVAGAGPALEHVQAMAKEDDRVVFLTDVDDEEKPLLMRGCAAYTLPTKPEPEFVETFGIVLAEKMLAGGGPVITTLTGGTGEAVGDAAVIIDAGDVPALAAAMDHVVLEMSPDERLTLERRARDRAMTFDRVRVFDGLFPDASTGQYA